MDFGAEIADRSYQEIPTGALRPRKDMLESAFEQNDKLKFDRSRKNIHFNYVNFFPKKTSHRRDNRVK